MVVDSGEQSLKNIQIIDRAVNATFSLRVTRPLTGDEPILVKGAV
jgi:hypothetical protein